MKDIRDLAKRERQFYARQDRCAACGRVLIHRKKGWACSRPCREKLEGEEGQTSPSRYEKGAAGGSGEIAGVPFHPIDIALSTPHHYTLVNGR